MDPIEQALALREDQAAAEGSGAGARAHRSAIHPHGRDVRVGRVDLWPQSIRHAALPEFKALKDIHKRFHESACAAICLCCTGKRAEAEAPVTTGEFQVLSEQMIVRLLAMQAALRRLKLFAASRVAQAPGHAQLGSPDELSRRHEVN